MKAIHTDKAPAAIGPYSQAIEVNGFVFASGQIPIDPSDRFVPRSDAKRRQSQSTIQQLLYLIQFHQGLDRGQSVDVGVQNVFLDLKQ